MSDASQPSRSGHLNADEHSIYWELFGNGDEFDVLLWDYPGQGRSSTADVPYHLDRIAGYLRQILDANAIDRIHVVGISHGGFVALEFARQFHQRLHSLVLSGIILSHETLFEMYEEAQDPFFAALDGRLPQYRAVPTPSLILSGEEDRVMAPKFQKKIASILPNSRFEIIEDSGHVVYLEQPDAFFNRILRLMRARAIV